MATEQANTGGGFLSLLTLIFITLKLTGHIDWSWWWVLSPVWIPLAIVMVLIACVAVYVALYGRGR